MQLMPGFGGGPSPPPAPPPLPTREDPAIKEARDKERMSTLRRRGRAGSILTSGLGVPGDATLDRAEARTGATLG